MNLRTWSPKRAKLPGIAHVSTEVAPKMHFEKKPL